MYAPTNVDVHSINNEILKLEGDVNKYISIDPSTDNSDKNLEKNLPGEFLNSLTPNGLPSHKLQLKEGAVVFLLRNINLNDDLCNGTRLIVRKLMNYSLSAEIISGYKTGNIFLILLIDLTSSKDETPFELKKTIFIKIRICNDN